MRVARLVAPIVVALAVLTAGDAGACESEPACRAARHRAAATYLSSLVRCRLRALDRVQECNATAFAMLERDLARADAERGCSVAGDVAIVVTAVSRTQDEELPQLLGFEDARFRCSQKRWTALARFARNLLQAHARDEPRPDAARLAAATARLEVQLGRALASALLAGDCNGGIGGDAPAVSHTVRKALVEEVCAVCGNGVAGAGEQCDGGDGPCPGQCAADCTCSAGGFCGNDRVDPGEECDGTDAAACAGASGLAQCGGAGREDACRCSSHPVLADTCENAPAPECPSGQSCADLVVFTPLPAQAHACIPPEPPTCSDGDDCALAADTCRAGECCASLGGLCGPQNPCCEGSSCGYVGFSPSICCREPLQPCQRDADCCQGVCELGPTGGFCAFF